MRAETAWAEVQSSGQAGPIPREHSKSGRGPPEERSPVPPPAKGTNRKRGHTSAEGLPVVNCRGAADKVPAAECVHCRQRVRSSYIHRHREPNDPSGKIQARVY